MDSPSDSTSSSLPQLVLTLFGLYARDEGNWLSIGSIVELVGTLGFEHQVVRSAVSRLKLRGVILSERRDGTAGYALAPATLEVLKEGDARIFESVRGTVESGWVLVAFSVPESEREKRHALRTTLMRLGFGVATPGVWIAPAHLAHETKTTLESRGLDEFVDLFTATYESSRDLKAEVATWWDLDDLAALYQSFLQRYRDTPIFDIDEAEAFRHYVSLLTEWRRLPYRDPGLPLALLPDSWKGEEATTLFHVLDRALRPLAERYAKSVVRELPRSR
jgi:phenylacetic acid degradation operon negative regulatory protein